MDFMVVTIKLGIGYREFFFSNKNLVVIYIYIYIYIFFIMQILG